MNAAVRVKICGITNFDDASAVIEAGADALGFNLFPGSKRHVRLEDIESWLPSLAGRFLRVAVMVNPSDAELAGARPHFDVIQLHGHETPGFCRRAAAAGRLWKALPLTRATSSDPDDYQADAILLDSFVPGAFGGTGILIDLEAAAHFVRACESRPVWLSGGLNPENVAEAVAKVRPFGVDVASGVEVPGEPRRKDIARVRSFVAAARSAR